MEISDWINRFYGHFLGQITIIESLKIIDPLDTRLYQKLSYVSMIDTLSQARYPKKNNQPRIVSFINSCSGWSDKDKVSIAQLSLHLDCVRKLEKEVGKSEKEDSELYKFVHSRLPPSDNGYVSASDVDLFFNEVNKMALEKEKKSVQLARYTELFYAYRNTLVHGFKEPAYGHEMSKDGLTPYYTDHYKRKPWQLVFPLGLFKALCKGCLDGLKEYLLKENINPYEQYEFGDMWTDPKKLFSKVMWEFFEWFKERNE